MTKKLLILIVTYNAEKSIAALLARLPDEIWQNPHYLTEILILDDASTDQTVLAAHQWAVANQHSLRIFSHPKNQGYGGNQKTGYAYALQHEFDIVLLLHGDGQYAPEYIPQLITPLLNNEAEAVFGSRMIHKKQALKGGMPLYKFIGNIALTHFQNALLNARLSEYHTGLRAYQVKALRDIPFERNSNDFIFDNEIIIQLLDNQQRIHEISIPTLYGDEISHVNSIKYGLQIIKRTLISRLQRVHLCYDARFDYAQAHTEYPQKTDFCSSHQFAIDAVPQHSIVLDIGCASGVVAKALKTKECRIYGYDHYRPTEHNIEIFEKFYLIDIDRDTLELPTNKHQIDTILLLDVIEHLSQPEKFIRSLREQVLPQQPRIIITTGNVAFFLMRIFLLFGQFNYGRRGILDFTHKRLFTFASLKSLLIAEGYEIEEIKGIPLPWPLFLSHPGLCRMMERLNQLLIKISRGLFSFQIAMIVRPRQMLPTLLTAAKENGQQMIKQHS